MQALSPELRAYAERVEEVATAFEADAYTWQGEIPWENLRLLADEGLYCPSIDEAYERRRPFGSPNAGAGTRATSCSSKR